MRITNPIPGRDQLLRRGTQLERLVAGSPKGMTIVELMIVLTIIASIMGVVGYSLMGIMGESDRKTATIEIRKLSETAATYYLSQSPRAYPDELSDLSSGPSPLVEELPKDPWGNAYIYEKPSPTSFKIYSAGPDGQPGTEDDVTGDLDPEES